MPLLPAEVRGRMIYRSMKPLLFVRFVGSFVLRFAVRQFAASLFQLPPRFTRFEPNDRSPSGILRLASGTANSPRPLLLQMKRALSHVVVVPFLIFVRRETTRPMPRVFGDSELDCDD